MTSQTQEMNIFLSYARQDEIKAEELYKMLSNIGYTPWMDKKDILPGQNWKMVLTKTIKNSTFFLACLTKNSVSKRGIIQVEIKQALEIWRQKLEDDIYLIPVKLEECSVPEMLSDLQWVDLFKDDGFKHLTNAIKAGMKRYGIIHKTETKSLRPLPHLLEKYDNFIDKLLSSFTVELPIDQTKPTKLILDNIRKIFNAELVYCVENDFKEILNESRSKRVPENFDVIDFHNKIKILIPKVHNFSKPHVLNNQIDETVTKKNTFVIVPIENELKNSLIVIYGIPDDFTYFEDVMGFILQKLYIFTEGFRINRKRNVVKSLIYDEIKSVYGYVSDKMYEERFNIFYDSLQSIQMHFEPIVHLSKYPNSIKIKGWEALARVEQTQKAPVKLFKAAELWGARFQTELDLHCLRKAFDLYIPQIRRSDDVKPLHVNVYPNALERTVYRKELRKLIEEQLLNEDEQLVLEISEKTWVPISNSDNAEAQHLEYFRKIMEELSDSFGVRFAIDDFGVGFSSIARLNRLRPSFVKVDRDVLHHEHDLGKETIKYLIGLVNKFTTKGISIIIEGLDEYSKISLSELVNELNVKLVQGYSLGMAKPQIEARLKEEKKNEIANLIKKGRI